MVALPAGDVASDVVAVVGQRAGLGGAAGEPSWPKNFAFSPVNWAHARARRLRRRSPRPGTPARRRHSRRTRRSGCRASARFVDAAGRAFTGAGPSLTPVHGSAITSVMGGSTSLGDLPVRPADLRRRAWSAGGAAC